jgi:ribonucleotide monophosphatase NagD (HAD superfamily)
MVGDDVRGDVGGAQGARMRGLLVRTGKFHHEDLLGSVTPDAVLDSVAALPDWWKGASSGGTMAG